MKPQSLLTLAFCLFVTSALSQGLNFINLNTDNGLPSNECYRIVQDKKGYIWVSTEAGLVKYNSKDFVLFGKDKGMPSTNDIYALDADDEGRVWFATGRWKVGYIKDDNVQILALPPKKETWSQDADLLYKMLYDDSSHTLYWSSHHKTAIITERAGVFSETKADIQTRNKDFLLIKTKDDYYLANLFNDRRENMTVAAPFNMALLNGDSLIVDRKPILTLSTESFSAVLGKDEYVVSLQNVIYLISKDGKVKQTVTLPSLVHTLLVDSKKNIWVGCKKNGVFVFENGNLEAKSINLLTEHSVSNLLEDRENGIWITTLEKGVFFCPNPTIKTADPLFTNSSRVYFSKVENGKLWLNSESVPLAVIDKDTTILHKLGNEQRPRVTDVLMYNNGYIVSTTIGVYFLNDLFRVIRQLPIEDNKTLLGGFGFLKMMNGNVLVYNNSSFYKVGLLKMNFNLVYNQQKIANAIVLKNDTVLFCNNNGLFERRSSFIARVETPSTKGLHNINHIYQDAQNHLWLPASSDTLTVLDENYNLKTRIFLKEKDITCRVVLQVSNTDFLVCSNKGLIKISFTDSSFTSYSTKLFDKTNGLTSSDVFNVSLFQNRYYVGTAKGLCIFDLPENLEHIYPPNTIISRCILNDSSVAIQNAATLAYNQNNISFLVDAIAFKKIGQRGFFYKYQLQGWDKEFKTSTGNTVSYSNLPPGNYTFIAKTFYDDGTEDTTPATFAFTIKPAFWQTWWGIAIICLIVVAMVFLFVQWRIKKIRLAEKEKATINQTIAEYRFTALKAQMDPHFIFNIVNVIQNLILEKDKTEAYNSLEKFSRLIRMVLNQSDSAFATIEEELALIDMYIGLNQLRVDHPFSFEKDIQPAAMQCQVPSLIIQPFIENAIWHGILPLKGSKPGIVSLKVSIEHENILIIEVMDNGVGRNNAAVSRPSKYHKSKGVELIQERLKAYRAMSHGSFAELNIIDLAENGAPTGTLVQIKISITDF